MTGNFMIKDDKIVIHNRGAMYGSIFSYFYDIGNKLQFKEGSSRYAASLAARFFCHVRDVKASKNCISNA